MLKYVQKAKDNCVCNRLTDVANKWTNRKNFRIKERLCQALVFKGLYNYIKSRMTISSEARRKLANARIIIKLFHQ